MKPFRILPIAMVAVMLSVYGCRWLMAEPSPTPDLYRFAIIRIAKGTVIDTVEGKYIALTDEKWFSELQCLALQKENAHLAQALVHAQRRR